MNSLENKKILVTGGAGFIGSHLVDTLIKKGHQVCIIDDLSTGLRKNINTKAKFLKTDIRSRKVNEIFINEKPDIVYHLAGQINLRTSLEDPVFDADVNILGSLNVLENCKKYKIKKIIFSSTGGALYGEAKTIPTPESFPTNPPSPYGLAKLTIEKYLEVYKRLYDIDYVSLRYANVYGPRQNVLAEAGVIAIFIQNILNNKPCIINGSGRQTRDYVCVDDVVRANLLAFEKNKVGVYNVGTGTETSVNQIFEKLAGGMRLLRRFSPRLRRVEAGAPRNDKWRKMPKNIQKKYGPAIKGELQRSALDCKKIKKEFGWKPKIDLDKGLEKTIKWFAKNK